MERGPYIRPIHTFCDPQRISRLWGLRDAQDFVVSALIQDDKNEVARVLCTKEGMALLQQLLSSRYISRRDGCLDMSFAGIAVPLCYLLSDSDFVHSNPWYLKNIYVEVVNHPNFFDNYYGVAEEGIECIDDWALSSRFSPENEFDVMIPFADLGYHILSRLGAFEKRDAIVAVMRKTKDRIDSMFNSSSSNGNEIRFDGDVVGDRWRSRLLSSSQRLGGLLSSTAPPVSISSPSTQGDYYREFVNDMGSIRNTQLYLSASELLSCPPTLPTYEEILSDSSIRPDDKLSAYVKYHFGLLREDVNMSFRTAVQHFLLRVSPRDRPKKFNFSDNGCEGSCLVFWNVNVEEMTAAWFKNVCFRISFDQPFQQDSIQERKIAWHTGPGKDMLQTFSLVCLIFDLPQDDKDQGGSVVNDNTARDSLSLRACKLVMATIGNVGRDELHESQSDCTSLQIMPVSSADKDELIQCITHANRRHGKFSIAAMLQVQGHFTSSNAKVLKALQTADWANMCLARRIVQGGAPRGTETHEWLNIPIFLNPALISSSTKFDLSFLTKRDLSSNEYSHTREILQSVRISDPENLAEILRSLEERIVLDKGQIKPFAYGLSQEVSLIHGPPGSGKNYIALQIAQALIVNSSGPISAAWKLDAATGSVRHSKLESGEGAAFPILCVCFTNHCLDNLLESMVLKKVVKLEEVLRLGAQSKSDVLKTRTINVVKKMIPCGSQYTHLSLKKQECAQLEERIREAMDSIRNSRASGSGIDLKKLYDQFSKAFDEVGAINNVLLLQVMRSVKVIGCTVSGAAINAELLKALGPKVIIFQEAAELLDAHILGAMTSRTQQIVLIGDHLQLRPMVREETLTTEANCGYDLDVSMFERLAEANTVPLARLEVQSRMHPEISKLARLSFYPTLKDADIVKAYPDTLRGLKSPVFFLDHSYTESVQYREVNGVGLPDNVFEAEFIAVLARYLIQQGYGPGQITVLTPYLSQILCIEKEMKRRGIPLELNDNTQFGLSNFLMNDDLVVPSAFAVTIDDAANDNEDIDGYVSLSTIDHFNGYQADVVLMSTVHCNDDGNIGCLESDNRVSMTLTRAKYGLIILGSARTIRDAIRGRVLKKVVQHLSEQKQLGRAIPLCCEHHGDEIFAHIPKEIPENGGCEKMCGFKKECGHICRDMCHPKAIARHDGTDCADCERA